MCDRLPPTVDPPENYHLDTLRRNVGQVVSVLCRNQTVAVVKCLPDLSWNATVPACPVEDESSNMSSVLIIVWVVGGVLLFSLIILIAIIISSTSKTGCLNRGNQSQSTSVFHISGGGRRAGGDNPAFTRADESCAQEWSFHRAGSSRLPSYMEATQHHRQRITTRDPVNQNRIEAPPSYQSSRQQNPPQAAGNGVPSADSQQQHHTHPSAAPPVTDQSNSGAPNIQGERERTVEENPTLLVRSIRNSVNLSEANNGVFRTGEALTLTNQIARNANLQRPVRERWEEGPGNPAPPSSPSSSRVADEEERGVSRRYVEEYPQCFWEEDPPPPYTPGPSDYNAFRSPARISNSRRGRQPPRLSYTAGSNSNSNSNTRHPHHHHLDPAGVVGSVAPPTTTTTTTTTSITGRESHDSNNSTAAAAAAAAASQVFQHAAVSSITPNDANSSLPVLSALSRVSQTASNVLTSCTHQETPRVSTTIASGHYNGQGASANTNTNTRPTDGNQEPLYVVRNIHATPITPPFHHHHHHHQQQQQQHHHLLNDHHPHQLTHEPYVTTSSLPSSPRPHRTDAPPNGTSTPIESSPMQNRRIWADFPAGHHFSPILSPRNIQHPAEFSALAEIRSYFDEELPDVRHPSPANQRRCYENSHHSQRPLPPASTSNFIHPRQASAPIARLDVEYF